mmetsp:Transcript_25512/g.54423  ORF Transcript_25512/g.54423 Transcript_25512/m.54423 type:complete len:217 (-) Transcript_25512:3342-3992(-)
MRSFSSATKRSHKLLPSNHPPIARSSRSRTSPRSQKTRNHSRTTFPKLTKKAKNLGSDLKLLFLLRKSKLRRRHQAILCSRGMLRTYLLVHRFDPSNKACLVVRRIVRRRVPVEPTPTTSRCTRLTQAEHVEHAKRKSRRSCLPYRLFTNRRFVVAIVPILRTREKECSTNRICRKTVPGTKASATFSKRRTTPTTRVLQPPEFNTWPMYPRKRGV